MSAIEQIAQLQAQGMNQDQIVGQLKSQGVPEQEIVNAMSQSQIKQAVSSDGDIPNFGAPGGGSSVIGGQPQAPVDQNMLGQGPPMDPSANGITSITSVAANQFPGGPQAPDGFDQFGGGGPQQGGGDPFGGGGDPYGGAPNPGQDPYAGGGMQEGPEGSGEYSGMQPSLMSQQGAPSPGGGEYSAAAPGGPGMGQEAVGGEYGAGEGMQDPYGGGAYPMYQPYQDAMSSDMITEISEQIVNEKLSALHDRLEGVLDMRTIVEANMVNLNDRLKRMEKIVDQMQVSILKKVGEYLTDVQDVKKELQETQKSFVSIQKGKKKHKH
ncbi:MAG: hypothetical protein ABH864_07340 [archaeon]